MTTGVACPTPILQFFDARGNPLVGGSILTQVGGVDAATYSDSGLTTALPNPIPLNSRGEVSTSAGVSSQLFLTPNQVYAFTASDANGNQIWVATYVNGVQISQQVIGELLWPQTAAELAAGVTPVDYYYEPGDARRYGCDPTGASDSASEFANWSAILGSYKGLLIGTFKSSASVAIPSGALVEWDAASVIKYTGNGAALTLSSVKDVTLVRPTIDISGAGSAAIALQINGGWLLDIDHPKVTALTGTNTQIGVQINTSASAGADFGAYCIRINNPNICAIDAGGNVQYGIQTNQTTSDTVAITHLQVLGGWINSGTTAGIKLSRCSSWRVEGTTCENVGDALQYSACDNGYISLGEVDASGYGVNPLDSTSSRITLVVTSLAGGYTSGYLNTTNSTPDMIDYGGELRMYPNGLSSSDYGVSYKAQYSLTAALVESVAAGGAFQTIRNINADLTGGGIHQLMRVAGISATGTAAANLRGTATLVGTSVAVTLPNAEPDADYEIFLTPIADPSGRLFVNNQTTTGFTINCSSSASVVVNWLLVR